MYQRTPVGDGAVNRNLTDIENEIRYTNAQNLTATQITTLNQGALPLGMLVYDTTNDVVKILVKSSGSRVFKTINLS